jgi:hypothetical protein
MIFASSAEDSEAETEMRGRPRFGTWFDELELLPSRHKASKSVLRNSAPLPGSYGAIRRAIDGISGVNASADCDSSGDPERMHARLVNQVLACELDLVEIKTKPV